VERKKRDRRKERRNRNSHGGTEKCLKEKRKSGAYGLPSWGAAVLRPYTVVHVVQNELVGFGLEDFTW
jgi:hypothetical protein